MPNESNQDAGLIRRGIFLLIVVGGIVAVVLWIIFQRPVQTIPTQSKQPEPHLAALVVHDAAFPGAISWTALGMVADTLPSNAGWEVRYNAAGSLARLGAKDVPWNVLAEMLDENQQMRNFRVRLESGVIVPDEAAARLTMISALKAIRQWHAKQTGPMESSRDYAVVAVAVDRLTESPVAEMKKQAEETRRVFSKR